MVLLSTFMIACVVCIPKTVEAARNTPTSMVFGLSEYQPNQTFSVPYVITSSGNGLAYVELYYQGGDESSFTKYRTSSNPDGAWTEFPIPFTASDDGVYQFYTRAFDASGHGESRKGAEASTTVDTIKPETEASLSGISGLNSWYLSSVTISFHVREEGSGVARTEYSLDDGDWLTAKNSLATVSETGDHSFSYRSIDRAGNKEDPRSISIKIDMTSPVVKFTASNGARFGEKATIDWKIVGAESGLVSMEMSLDGGDFKEISVTTTSLILRDLGIGNHSIIIRSEDAAGGTSESRLDFLVSPQADLLDLESSPLVFLGMIVLTFAGVIAAISWGKKRNQGQRP